MGKKDPRVDAYIAKSAEFARPILKHIRKVVHAALPAVEEDFKWGAPHFMYKGMLCGMAAFKQHCSFGFWRAKELAQEHEELGMDEKRGMVQFGNLKLVSDLPSDKVLTKLVKASAELNDSGTKSPRATKSKKPAPKIPADFLAALKKSKMAHANFSAFSPSHRREYIEWITEAKRDETRQRRIATALEWIAEGKSHNWKYEKK
ncbi:MAG TPA: YdeI/OmpD-associated family protein [Lacipirellulaceae bacterium]|jgi:uncharacterized protein YdeI (YjbR/CyaY-like superfamily)|nr:YdeI/OmpD-associated family protein [Lacipirellulaceae bacterium]